VTVSVDYGLGNLSSAADMLREAGGEVPVSRDPAEALRADKLLLRGVGHFDYGMKMLNDSGLCNPIDEFALYVACLGLVRGDNCQERALSI
jgi:glutamine amidotransferase